MATLTVTTTDRDGVNLDGIAVAAGASGDQFTNTGRELFYVNNASAGARTITFDIQQEVDGQSVTDRTANVPAGEHRIFGPFSTNAYNNSSTGRMSVSYDSETSVTVAAIKMRTTQRDSGSTSQSLSRLDLVDLGGGVHITQVDDQSWDPGIQSLIARGAGGTHPLFGANQVQEPKVNFTTSQLKTLLDRFSSVSGIEALFGMSIDTTNAATPDPVVGYFASSTPSGKHGRASLAHRRGEINFVYVYIERLNLPSNDDATADVVCAIGYDGSNEPFVWTENVALDSTNLSSEEHFGGGPVYLNGLQVESIQETTIETGINLDILSADSVVWPTVIHCQQTEPVITVTTREMKWVFDAQTAGNPLDGTNGLVAYARKFTKNTAGGVARHPNGSPVHLQFQALNGRYFVEPRGDGSNPTTAQIRVEVTGVNDTTFPITTNTAISIP